MVRAAVVQTILATLGLGSLIRASEWLYLSLKLAGATDATLAIKAVKPKALQRVIVDTTVQEKAIAHAADSRLLFQAFGHRPWPPGRLSASLRSRFAFGVMHAKNGRHDEEQHNRA